MKTATKCMLSAFIVALVFSAMVRAQKLPQVNDTEDRRD